MPRPMSPSLIAQRAANAPLALAVFSLLGWILITGVAVVRVLASVHEISLGLGVHLVIRPVLAGLIAAAARSSPRSTCAGSMSGPRSS